MNPSPSLQLPTDPSLSTRPPESGRIRAVGWVLIVLGPGLSAAMALAARELYGASTLARLTGRPVRWHGSPEFTRTAFELFGAVFLIGVAVFLGGVYQVRTGRRHRVLVVFTLGLAAVTAYLVCSVIAQPMPR